MQANHALSNLSDRTLRRLTIGVSAALVIGLLAVGAFYWFDRHPSSGPSLNDRAVAAAEEAVRTSPNDIGVRNHLAAAYVSAGRFEDGIAQFTQVLAAAPSDRAALLGRGLAYLAQGTHDPAKLDGAKLDLATADFQKLVDAAKDSEFAKTDPQLEQAYYELGVIALKQSRSADAVTNLTAALAINGGDADALYSFGVALIQTGDATKGVAALRRAVQFVPTGWCEPYHGLQDGYTALKDSVGSQWAVGMTAMCDGNFDAAATALQGLTAGPMKIDALLGLALVAQQRGDNTGAAGFYRQVLAIDPKNTSASIGLGQLGVTGSPAPQGTN
ncbi:MAG: tetratricopeptide repeat protein [Chloroflexi bacterium]|nr:tetratricopeptide repeat protein [Chloroflexota bacterium]